MTGISRPSRRSSISARWLAGVEGVGGLGRKIAQRLAKAFGAAGHQRVEDLLFALDLLLEDRRQDHRARRRNPRSLLGLSSCRH